MYVFRTGHLKYLRNPNLPNNSINAKRRVLQGVAAGFNISKQDLSPGIKWSWPEIWLHVFRRRVTSSVYYERLFWGG
jgi:hypothetical protein